MVRSLPPHNPNRLLRGGLVGTGSIAAHHLMGWQQIPEVEIVAVADVDLSRARSRCIEFGMPSNRSYSSIEELLLSEPLDFVDIATPPQFHRDHVLTAASFGVHVLCQKPFATSAAEAQTMISACRERGVRCVVNENWRWRSWYREIRRLLDAGTIGPVREAVFRYHGDEVLPRADGGLPEMLTRQPYTQNIPQLILFDWGIHLVDVLRYLFGPVSQVSATMESHSPLVIGEDRARVDMQFRSGVKGTVDLSWSSPRNGRAKMVRGCVDPMLLRGESGTLELLLGAEEDHLCLTVNGEGRSLLVRSGLSRAEAYQLSFTDAQRHFINCLRSGTPAENEAEDNLETLNVVFAAYESAASGKPVCLPEPLSA